MWGLQGIHTPQEPPCTVVVGLAVCAVWSRVCWCCASALAVSHLGFEGLQPLLTPGNSMGVGRGLDSSAHRAQGEALDQGGEGAPGVQDVNRCLLKKASCSLAL